ncbi:MAG: preprotein translocase subunit SecE [Bdellovibrionales bacterium]
MDNDNKKILTTAFVLAGLVSFLVISLLIDTFSTLFPFVARIAGNDVVKHGLPILVGFGVFAALQFNNNVVQFCEEVVTEIRKIVWPSRKDTVAMTIVVCMMLLVSGVLLGVFDTFSSFLVTKLLEMNW